MSKLTEQKKQHIVKEIDATMTIENMPLTNTDKDRIKRYLDHKITINDAIAEIKKECEE